MENKKQCCTPEGQIKRYVDCIGCDQKPMNTMSDKKESSIEWLQWAFEHTILTHEQIMQTIGLFEQAKAMHKDEIEEAYGHGQNNGYMYANQRAITISKDNYFNQTFGGQDNE